MVRKRFGTNQLHECVPEQVRVVTVVVPERRLIKLRRNATVYA